MAEKPFETQMECDSWVFGTLHADLMGPMTPEARWSHARFSLLIHDDSSSFGFAFNLIHKNQTAKIIIGLDKVIENKFQKQVHTLKTDNGGKFINDELQAYYQERCITSSTLVAYNPELNGCAERQNRTHIEGVQMMLKDFNLGKDLWGEALLTHIYIHNHCPCSTLLSNVTPYKKIFGHEPSIGHLRIFGSKCFIKVPDESWTKLDDKAKECRLIGYE